MIDLPTILLVPALALSAAWWTELIGVPVAWFKVRRSQAWQRRPPSTRRLRLLKDFIGVYIFGSALFAGLAGLAAWVGTALS